MCLKTDLFHDKDKIIIIIVIISSSILSWNILSQETFGKIDQTLKKSFIINQKLLEITFLWLYLKTIDILCTLFPYLHLTNYLRKSDLIWFIDNCIQMCIQNPVKI